MFKMIAKKIITILHSKSLLTGNCTYALGGDFLSKKGVTDFKADKERRSEVFANPEKIDLSSVNRANIYICWTFNYLHIG